MARNNPEYLKEINEIIDSVEKSQKIKFREGYNPNCKCIKLTLDPVEAIPRPFVFYAFDIQEGSPPSRISYWYYDPHSHHDSFSPKKSRQKPIVFIHGVGGGLFCYFNFIRKLWKLNRPLFLVELPYVSLQMIEDVPTMEETVREIEEMLTSRNYSKAIFVGHSLGTAVCTWMFKEARKRIGGLVLIDPIIFLLHHPNVAYNFKYRIPRAANEVYKYLSKHNVKAHMMRKLDHGSFLFNTHWEDKIIADVLKCCNSRRS
ncbi:5899_t:CDS:2 [Racocetra fulgida]|uniref:5899_t:CDS:1 n=1 Tax=Racocetra fulgida TaxID=60492 RepID=A0A9N8VZE5_9GLOM|nr:5899_t:CDS:2 [Racocetra fulgida]